MLIAAARLFDGRADSIVEDPLIEVAAGRIVNVTRRDDCTGNSDVIDLGDVTVLPGLIDVHQHLAFDASNDPVPTWPMLTTPPCCCACASRHYGRWRAG